MRRFFIVLLMASVAGCASNQLGQEARLSTQSGDLASLKITGRFNPAHCSDHFAYIDLSIENPTGNWLSIQDLKFHFPYNSDQSFAVLEGEELAYWREGEIVRQKQVNHNFNVGMLAMATAGIGMMASSNKRIQSAGATVYSATAATNVASNVARRINKAETGSPIDRNYLAGRNVKIPPGMTRKFWLVMQETQSAPLMAAIGGTFKNGDNEELAFAMPLERWQQCQWQKARKRYLKQALTQDLGRNANRIEDVNAMLIAKEHEIQASN